MTSVEQARAFPGARRPNRTRAVSVSGLRLNVVEWGDESAPPLLLAHGGFDFAGTFDVFAPMLADGGWRVVAWDHRGHGDSEHAELYSWQADMRDALAVLESARPRGPVPFIGHSKGGNILLELAEARPDRISRMVNIDGLPSTRRHPDVEGRERTRLLSGELTARLDARRRLVGLQRKPGTIDGLAERRGRMNPRLSMDWLRYLVTVGAREDPDGWRWKLDPAIQFGGFGPWRPSWALERLGGFGKPLLGMLGTATEPMGWGTDPEELRPFLPPGGRLEVFEGVGHFVHIERPREVADLVLDFLGSPA